MKRIAVLAFLCLTFGMFLCASAQALPKRPKLILFLVIDQFRADYLLRFESRFMPSKGKDGNVGGFRYLMNEGAYYPVGEYDILHSMTGPGHSTVLTGAYPYQSGIPTNYWFSEKTWERAYCMEDPAYRTILSPGAPEGSPHLGTSPRSLISTTLGDELKNSGLPSRVVALALKDRAAILMGGHRADLTFWFDAKTGQWASSSFYLPEQKLPGWLDQLNQEVKARHGEKLVWKTEGRATGYSADDLYSYITAKWPFGNQFPHESSFGAKYFTSLPVGLELTETAAERALDAFKLGRRNGTDLLAVSFSTHDYMAHAFGPNSREMEELTVAEDRVISKLLNYVRKNTPGGLKDVVIVLTADHGSPTSPEWLAAHRIAAGRISETKLSEAVATRLEKKFGKPDRGSWVSLVYDLNFYLNDAAILEKKLDRSEVEREAKRVIANDPGVAHVFGSVDWETRRLPPGMHERQILHTYYPGRSGDVVAIPRPYFMPEDEGPVVHLTGYTYDRTVPIILAGALFRPGIYANRAEVIDIAPTLSFVSNVLPPSLSEGRVLSEALLLNK